MISSIQNCERLIRPEALCWGSLRKLREGKCPADVQLSWDSTLRAAGQHVSSRKECIPVFSVFYNWSILQIRTVHSCNCLCPPTSSLLAHPRLGLQALNGTSVCRQWLTSAGDILLTRRSHLPHGLLELHVSKVSSVQHPHTPHSLRALPIFAGCALNI